MFSEGGLKHSPGGHFLPAEVFVTQAGLLTFLPAPYRTGRGTSKKVREKFQVNNRDNA